MNQELFVDKLKKFKEFKYGFMLNQSCILPEENKSEMIDDEDIWAVFDGQTCLDKESALKKYCTPLDGRSLEELSNAAISLSIELSETEYMISKFNEDSELAQAILCKSESEDLCDLDEAIAKLECAKMESEEYQNLQSNNIELKKLWKQVKNAGMLKYLDAEFQQQVLDTFTDSSKFLSEFKQEPDYIKRSKEFSNFYQELKFEKEQFLPLKHKEKILSDEEVWDGQDNLEEDAVLKKYCLSWTEDSSEEELRELLPFLIEKIKNTVPKLEKFVKISEDVFSLFDSYDSGERILAAQETLKQIEQSDSEIPIFKDLLKENAEFKNRLQEYLPKSKEEVLNQDISLLTNPVSDSEDNEFKSDLQEIGEYSGKIKLLVQERNTAIAEKSHLESIQYKLSEDNKKLKKDFAKVKQELSQTKPFYDKYNAHPALNLPDGMFEKMLAANSNKDKIVAEKESVEKEAAEAKAEKERIAKEKEDAVKKVQELEKVKVDSESKQKTLQKTAQDLLKLSEDYDKLLQEKQDMESNQETLVENAVKAKEEELAKQYGAKVKERVAEINALKEDKKQKQSKINEYDGKVAQLNLAALAKDARIKGLEDDIADLNTNFQEAQEKASSVDELNAEIIELHKDVEDYQAEMGVLFAELSAEKQAIQDNLTELTSSTAEFGELQQTVNEYEAELSELREKASSVDELNAEIIELHKDVEDYQAEMGVLFAELSAEKQEAVASVELQVAELTEAKQSLEQRAVDAETQLEELRTRGHEGEDVVSKAKYDEDTADLINQKQAVERDLEANSRTVDFLTNRVAELTNVQRDLKQQHQEAIRVALEEKDNHYNQLLADKESEYNQNLENQRAERERIIRENDERNAGARQELFDENTRLQEQLEQARQNAVEEGMTVISVEYKERLEADIARLQEQLEQNIDPGEAYIDQTSAIHEKDNTIRVLQNALIARNTLLINKNDEIARIQQDYADLEDSFNQVSAEYRAAVNAQASQESEEEPVGYFIFDKLDELAALYNISFTENARIDDYLDFVDYLKEQKTNAASVDDTQVIEPVSAEPVQQAAASGSYARPAGESAAQGSPGQSASEQASAHTVPSQEQTQEPVLAPEPAAPESSVVTSASEPEPVASGASIDDAVASAGPSVDTDAQALSRERQFSQSEQAWYNLVGYALKQPSETKKGMLNSYLANSGIENKRVDAYILGVLAEDAFHKAEFDEALRLNRAAYEACGLAESVFADSEFDRVQKSKIECNIRFIERKKAA